jgi:hypothetical protein
MSSLFSISKHIALNVPVVYDENGGTKGLTEQDRRRFCAGMRRGSETT